MDNKSLVLDDDKDNKLVEDVRHAEYEFKFNFINTPWDDRSTKSKIGIISLLIAIFVATMAMITHNFYMHYMNTPSGRRGLSGEINCHLVKADQNTFVARIHSMETQELLCLGALISPTSVLANGVCTKSGPVHLRLGSSSSPLCKKGFAVKTVDPINHNGTSTRRIMLLKTYESMANCGEIIKIGETLETDTLAYIIGRPLSNGKLLSQQPAKLMGDGIKLPGRNEKLIMDKTICVTDVGKCPVKAGDLLVQNSFVYGLASTSTHFTESSKIACFADLRFIRDQLTLE